MKLVTSAIMRAIDSETIDNCGIPGATLMENAGSGIAEYIIDEIIESLENASATVFCGKGNNGGDGYVVARHLASAGVDVQVFFIGPIDKLSPDARLNFDRAAGIGLTLTEVKSADDLPERINSDLIVDALLGTGFSGVPEGLVAELIEYVNLQDAEVVSVDLPSGLDADTGVAEGAVIAADHTCTLALPKYGLFLSPGRELAGQVEIIPIGVPDNVISKFNLRVELTTLEGAGAMLPVRKPDGHKGDFGKLFLIAGSTGLTGAAALASLSAARTGCGLVKLGCPSATQPVLGTKLTEVMTVPLPDVARKGALALRSLGEIRKYISLHDAVIIGPGVGTHHETSELMRRLLMDLDKPAIIDADGLNAFAGHSDLIANRKNKSPLVLTPHPGEFARLMELQIPEDIPGRTELVIQTARALNAVLILKGSPTLVGDPLGKCFLNPTGNSGMATGGSGDVLSGIIGSFLAQGMTAIDAAVCGVYLHGLAGDLAADMLTERAMIAGDIIDYFPQAFELMD
jgi:hydroxyethylthiazole kinase-like uncharacterized protein yjeF